MMFCASCGTTGSEDIKLKKCTACHLVRYCSVKCQRDHRPKHKKECKKRAAELRDELLFKQPDSSHHGDCPICCLPLLIDRDKTVLNTCCSKYTCIGCNYANKKREALGRLQPKCPFCRKVVPPTDEEIKERLMRRIDVDDPIAICEMGITRRREGDYKNAFEYFSKASALGDAEAHFQLSILFRNGLGVHKDGKKGIHHAEQAAIKGHPEARHYLGCMEMDNGRMDRAAKHYVIASKLGYDGSVNALKIAYRAGLVSKEDFATALSGYQSVIEETKSPQRDEAAKFTWT